MKSKTLLVLVLVSTMLLAMAPLMPLSVKAENNSGKSITRADAETENTQPTAEVWGSQKKWAYQYWYAYGQAYNSPTWPGQGILYSSGFAVDSGGYYSFTLPVPPSAISYLDVGIYGKAVSGNGLDVYVWNWATSVWDYVATTPTAEGHKYWGVSPTNHVQGSSYEYRIRVNADDVPFPPVDDRYDMWYIDTYYKYTPPSYSATIWSWDAVYGWLPVSIWMDGAYTGFSTPHTFTVTGTHTFTVPNTNSAGHVFYEWSTGSTSTTITVSGAGTYTARYREVYSATIWSWCAVEGWIARPIYKDGVYTGFSTPYTFTGLYGTHTFTVPSTDASGHVFYEWSTGSTSTTITVSGAGTYTARYKAAGTITVTYPNGGERWIRGQTYPITWTWSGTPGPYVKIELLKGGVLNSVIAASTPNDGSYSWTIPPTQTLGTDFKIKITSTTYPSILDSSNSNFAIVRGILTVTSPNGGESWKRGTTHTITWSKAGVTGANVKIELLKGGVPNRVIIASTPNDGSFNWSILAGQAIGANYKIRITSIAYPSIKDASNSNFSITA